MIVGWCTTVFYWPMFFFLDLLNLELFSFPNTQDFFILLGMATINCIGNLAFIIGVLVTTPLWMTVGLLFTIPLSAVFDFLVQGITPTGVGWAGIPIGMMLVIIGVLLLNVAEVLYDHGNKEHLADEKKNQSSDCNRMVVSRTYYCWKNLLKWK